jgi:pimeloyl-ACP methyl ester carboxylesterase
MSKPIERILKTNGISLNIVEQGQGPLVLLCHGFPESWYSWRHQINALAEAGFYVVAPDMRGYGKSERPEAIDQYTIFHLVGDLVGLLDGLEIPTAVIIGHDWGATIAWQAARVRPDRFRAPPLPSWLSEADLDVYAGEFARSGFRGSLNYYRNVDRNWELMAAFDGTKVTVPALYIAGDHDMVVASPGAAEQIANMKHVVPLLRDIQMLPGCGHWTQQERPAEVSAAIIEFLRGLPN